MLRSVFFLYFSISMWQLESKMWRGKTLEITVEANFPRNRINVNYLAAGWFHCLAMSFRGLKILAMGRSVNNNICFHKSLAIYQKPKKRGPNFIVKIVFFQPNCRPFREEFLTECSRSLIGQARPDSGIGQGGRGLLNTVIHSNVVAGKNLQLAKEIWFLLIKQPTKNKMKIKRKNGQTEIVNGASYLGIWTNRCAGCACP